MGDGEPSTTRRDVVPEACVIAVCASGDAREVQDALLHEAMHGLWYARDDFARWCYDFYLGDALDDAERAAGSNSFANFATTSPWRRSS